MDKYYNHTEELYNRQELEARNPVLLRTLASTMVSNNANIALTISSLGNISLEQRMIMVHDTKRHAVPNNLPST